MRERKKSFPRVAIGVLSPEAFGSDLELALFVRCRLGNKNDQRVCDSAIQLLVGRFGTLPRILGKDGFRRRAAENKNGESFGAAPRCQIPADNTVFAT